MSRQMPISLDAAFIPRSRMTLAECIARLREHPDLTPARRRDLISALKRLSAALGRTPDTVPADPAWLQPRIAKVHPAAIGQSQKSWTNVLSDAKAAFAALDIVPKAVRLSDLSPLWAGVWRQVLDSGNLRVSRSLGRFVRCMDSLGIAPEAVNVAAAQAYKQALEAAELHAAPEESMYSAIRGWNRAGRELPWWPGTQVILPPRHKTFVLPPGAFPASFRADVARFRKRMEAPDLLDPDALAAPLRPATVSHRIAQTWRLASAVAHGGVPVASIVSFNNLLEPQNIRRGLEWLLARHGGRVTASLSDVGTLIRILTTYLTTTLSDADRTDTIALSRRIIVQPRPGMTEQNRTRLRPFQDNGMFARLLHLTDVPDTRSPVNWTFTQVRRHELLLAIRILLFCPIRRKNLAGIHLERNLLRLTDGRVFLRFAPEEVKNRKLLEFQLDPSLVKMIDNHLRHRAPHLPAGPCDWLFAGGTGAGPRSANNLGTQIQKLITRELGVTVNLHLFRHLAAMRWLQAEPGNYEVARLFLGHSTLSSTISAYADFDQSAAIDLLGQVVRQRGKG